jgi:hypothetical protein
LREEQTEGAAAEKEEVRGWQCIVGGRDTAEVGDFSSKRETLEGGESYGKRKRVVDQRGQDRGGAVGGGRRERSCESGQRQTKVKMQS